MLLEFVNTNNEVLVQMEKQFPNDMEFGKNIRDQFGDSTFKLNLPNDQELGKSIRKIIKKL